MSLKAKHEVREVDLDQHFTLNGTCVRFDTKSGELNDLEPAIKADLDKYLAIVDIGEFFKKVQVAAKTNVNWAEKLPDGTELSDPIQTIQVEVGYPDFSQPLGTDKKPNPQYRAEGFHYVIGHKDPNHGSELAVWTKDNPQT